MLGVHSDLVETWHTQRNSHLKNCSAWGENSYTSPEKTIFKFSANRKISYTYPKNWLLMLEEEIFYTFPKKFHTLMWKK